MTPVHKQCNWYGNQNRTNADLSFFFIIAQLHGAPVHRPIKNNLVCHGSTLRSWLYSQLCNSRPAQLWVYYLSTTRSNHRINALVSRSSQRGCCEGWVQSRQIDLTSNKLLQHKYGSIAYSRAKTDQTYYGVIPLQNKHTIIFMKMTLVQMHRICPNITLASLVNHWRHLNFLGSSMVGVESMIVKLSAGAVLAFGALCDSAILWKQLICRDISLRKTLCAVCYYAEMPE